MTETTLEGLMAELSDFYRPDEKLLIATIGLYRIIHPNKSYRSIYREVMDKFDREVIKSALIKLQASKLVTY